MTKEKVNRPSLPKTLEMLQFMRTAKGRSDAEIHAMLSDADKECKKNDVDNMLERLMIHVGDVSRQHNILSELGVKSATGGAQERAVFRSILRWWSENKKRSFKKNIRNIVEFTVLENVMFYQVKTDRRKGTLISTEVLMPMREVVYDFLAAQIRSGKNLNLIARHLPKYATGKSRVTKKTIKARPGVESFNWTLPTGKSWVKLNGEPVSGEKIEVRTGDVVSYPREKQSFTMERQKMVNDWVRGFCDVMGWDIEQYKEFRKLQDTAEQRMSDRTALNMSKAEFHDFLDGLTGGQRLRVARSVCSKDGETLTPRAKWGDLGEWYKEWESGQEVVAQQARDAFSEGDETARKKAVKNLKVKATGMQTADLLADTVSGKHTRQQVDNAYQSLVEKMDLVANVFPIIDGSASMNSQLGRSWYASADVDSKYKDLSAFMVAAALCVTFSTRNPVEEFRNTFGWFSNDFRIVGKSKYVNDAPNQYVSSSAYKRRVNEFNILSEKSTFTENMEKLLSSNPGEVSSTNMFASIEYFVNLVRDGKMHVESLPQALLYITDGENNTGRPPKEALELAYSIGWNPLLIFWALQRMPDSLARSIKGVPNILMVSGFSESVLSQVLRGIKSGSIDPQDELWSLYESPRYAIVR